MPLPTWPTTSPSRATSARPDAIADAFWLLAQQDRSAWTFELDVRPFGERW